MQDGFHSESKSDTTRQVGDGGRDQRKTEVRAGRGQSGSKGAIKVTERRDQWKTKVRAGRGQSRSKGDIKVRERRGKWEAKVKAGRG